MIRPPSPSPTALRRVLCADDDPLIRALVAATLRHEGLDVRLADSGAQVLRMLGSPRDAEDGDTGDREDATWRPDLLLLDVLMPGMDGPQTLAALRTPPLCSPVPVAFLTAANRPVHVDRYLAMGAIGAVGKPIDPLDLANRLRVLWGGWLAREGRNNRSFGDQDGEGCR